MDAVIGIALFAGAVYYIGAKKGWWPSFGWPKGPDA